MVDLGEDIEAEEVEVDTGVIKDNRNINHEAIYNIVPSIYYGTNLPSTGHPSVEGVFGTNPF